MIVIFWAAVMAIVFFVIGAVFKGIVAFLSAFFETIGKIALIILCAMLGILAVGTLYGIADGIMKGSIAEILGMVVMLLVQVGFTVLILVWLGRLILDFFAMLAEFILDIILLLFEWVVHLCEDAYGYFLRVIVKRTEKC